MFVSHLKKSVYILGFFFEIVSDPPNATDKTAVQHKTEVEGLNPNLLSPEHPLFVLAYLTTTECLFCCYWLQFLRILTMFL